MNYPEVKALSKPEYLIVLLHGVGSDGHDLIDLVPMMQPQLPNCYFISPHGVEPYDMAPFGRQWFSLKNRDIEVLKSLAKPSSDSLMKIIEDKQHQLELANAQTIILGFSQGTMLGSYTVLNADNPFRGFVGFSGALIPPEICKNKNTEICLIHGIDDEIVPIEKIDIAEQYLKQQEVPYVSHKLPNLRHTINHKGLNIAIEFITKKVTN